MIARINFPVHDKTVEERVLRRYPQSTGDDNAGTLNYRVGERKSSLNYRVGTRSRK